jgi:hypothetical protein
MLQQLPHPDRQYGPLQIVHDFRFTALNLPDQYAWLEEASLDEKRAHIRGRLERLAGRGFAGVVLNVAFKSYLDDEQAWLLLVWIVDTAQSLGLRIWIYDEQYYPSGSAGGVTLRDHPELEARGLVCVNIDTDTLAAPVRVASPCGHSSLVYAYAVPRADDILDFAGQIDLSRFSDAGGGLCWHCPGGSWRVYCFFTRTLFEGTYLCRALRAPRRNISVCDARAVKRFLDVTFDPYRRWLGERLGGAVEAVFTDEPSLLAFSPYPEGFDPQKRHSKLPTLSIHEKPNLDIPLYPYIHWPDGLEAAFAARAGYALADCLPKLFAGGPDAQQEKLTYLDAINQLFDHAYNLQYKEKLAPLRLAYSGHMLAEEAFDRHPILFGDILRNLGRMDIPGCDLLYSDPDKLRWSTACKLASSAAHLYQRKHVMIEASNMSDRDQDLTLKRLTCAMAIEFAHGVDLITSYYGEQVLADADYAAFTTYVARLASLFDGGTHQTQALVYYPFRQIAAHCPITQDQPHTGRHQEIGNSLTQLSQKLWQKQIDFDYINDEKLLECQIESGRLITPGGEQPRWLLFPEIDAIDAPIAAWLRQVTAAGITVAFCGPEREITGLPDCQSLIFMGDAVPFASQDLILDPPRQDILVLHKQIGSQARYLLVNTGSDGWTGQVSIPAGSGRLVQADILTGDLTDTNGDYRQGRIVAECVLPGFHACVLLFEPQAD